MKTKLRLLTELEVRFEFIADLQEALANPETSDTEVNQILKELEVLHGRQQDTEAELQTLLETKKPSLFKRIFKK